MQFALLAWMFFCLATGAWSQTRIKLNVVYPAVTGVMTALWTAAEAKAFQKYGLDVNLLYSFAKRARDDDHMLVRKENR